MKAAIDGDQNVEEMDVEQDHARALRMSRFLDSGSLRASLYRNKLHKVLLNPSEPLVNPYRVSAHDQMPVRVMPSSPARKSIRRSAATTFISQKWKKTLLEADQTISEKENHNSLSAVNSRYNNMEDLSLSQSGSASVLKPQNRTCSFDSLVQKPYYLTRNALKRIEEQKRQDLDEINSSFFSEKGNQSHNFSSRSGLRSAKSRKSFHKFNLFSKSSKVKSTSEFTLHEVKSFENLNSTSVDLDATTTEKKQIRKKRLSGFRTRFQKTFPDNKNSIKRKSNKRKSSVFQNVQRNEDGALSLQDVLMNRDLCEEFRKFLSHEHSDENLDFWTICEKYKTSNNQRNLAEVIHRQFLDDGAPREVNLDAKTKISLQENTRNLKSDSFFQAQESIYRLMEEDSFRRFTSTWSSKRKKRER